MYLPMAHAEGKFLTASPEILRSLSQAGRLALRYCAPSAADANKVEQLPGQGQEHSSLASYDEPILPFPHNPNGAQANVAGLCDASGRMFGLMPHPERHLDATHHPFWTRRREQPAEGDGMKVFRNAIEYFA